MGSFVSNMKTSIRYFAKALSLDEVVTDEGEIGELK